MAHRRYKKTQFLASAVMEVCWLFCWASFTMAVLSDHLFPYLKALLTFSIAVLLTFYTDRSVWHRILKGSLLASGILIACLLMLHASMFPHQPLWGRAWVIALFTMTESVQDWLLLGLVIFWTLAFWINGNKLARRPASYWSVCRRFDFGIVMFLGYLVVKIFLVHQGIQIKGQTSGWMMLPFLVLGLLAIGLARNQQQVQTTYMVGYRTIGVLLSFVLVVAIATIGLSSLFWPLFVVTAESGYGLLQAGLKPVAPVAVGALTWFFRGSMKSLSESSTGDDTIAGSMVPVEGGGSDLLAVLLWGIFGSIFVLSVVGLIGFTIWRLVRWLLSQPQAESTQQSPSIGLLAWFMELPRFLVYFWDWFCQHLRRKKEISEVYAALLRWGQQSGVKHGENETPQEYCLRLGLCFPDLHTEIALITELFQQRTYAEKPLDQEQFRHAEQALKQMRSPIFWPTRLSLRISYNDQ